MNVPKQKAGPPAGIRNQSNLSLPKLLTVQQVADLTGLRPATVYLWITMRRLPVVRLGRAVRVPADALAALIAANTIPAQPEGGVR
jgi:excisionase family DNA binding protein